MINMRSLYSNTGNIFPHWASFLVQETRSSRKLFTTYLRFTLWER
jgi:hypothetical protein